MVFAHQLHGCPSGIPCADGASWVEITLDLLPLVAVAAASLLYLAGWRRVRKSGAGPIDNRRLALFGGGTLLLVAVLMIPLFPTGEQSLAVHMLQHELVFFAPLLYVMARAGTGMMLGLEPHLRGAVARRLAKVTASISWLRRRDTATAILVATFTLWHIPILFDTALESTLIHGMEHLAFLAAGALYWAVIVGGRRSGRGWHGGAIASLFTMMLIGTAAGALLTFASTPVYPVASALAGQTGLDWLMDQRLAGLLMWLPPGVVMLGLASWIAASWLSADEPRATESEVAS